MEREFYFVCWKWDEVRLGVRLRVRLGVRRE